MADQGDWGSRTRDFLAGRTDAATKAIGEGVASARTQLGEALQSAEKTRWLQQLGRSLGANWVLGLLDRVNTVRVLQTVVDLRRKYPEATNDELVGKLVRNKAVLAGGVGALSGFVPPGLNLPFAAADALTVVALELELVYEVAAVYGFDLGSPDRRGEAAMVLALGTGSDRLAAVGTGLVKRYVRERIPQEVVRQLARILGVQLAERLLLRGVPLVAGAVVGAGANLAALTLVGNAASRFYRSQSMVAPPGASQDSKMPEVKDASLPAATEQ